MLLTGDSEETERQWWLRNDPSSGAQLHDPQAGASRQPQRHRRPLAAACAHPELAVASMGRNNEFGHPHPETVSLLRRTGIPLLRTDQLGTITITSDGRDWQVTEPSFARAGRPTQADVDRVAAATATHRRGHVDDDGAPECVAIADDFRGSRGRAMATEHLLM